MIISGFLSDPGPAKAIAPATVATDLSLLLEWPRPAPPPHPREGSRRFREYPREPVLPRPMRRNSVSPVLGATRVREPPLLPATT